MTYINFSSRYKRLPNAAAKKICLLLLSEPYFIGQTFRVCCLSYKVFLLHMFNEWIYILSLFQKLACIFIEKRTQFIDSNLLKLK